MPATRWAAGAAVLAVVGGVWLATQAPDPAPAALPPAAPSATAPATSGTPSAGPVPDTAPSVPEETLPPVSDAADRTGPGDVPVTVRIPAIDVESRLVRLGIAQDGTMEVPQDYSRAGWLRTGPVPGGRGPAVIAGHVDSHRGPAVFFRLRELRPGDEIEVTQKDGDVVTFVVRSVEQYAKAQFPTERVYGPVPGPVLRLITCSGEIDPVSGHYIDNTVVFAT